MPLKDLKGILWRDQHPKGLVIELLLALHSFCVLKGCQYHCCGSWWAEMKWAGHKPYFRLQTSTSRYLPSGNSTQRKRKKNPFKDVVCASMRFIFQWHIFNIHPFSIPLWWNYLPCPSPCLAPSSFGTTASTASTSGASWSSALGQASHDLMGFHGDFMVI